MRIAIYSRKSVYVENSESIETQINLCKSYFNNKYPNCTFDIFEDEGFSGKNTNRPAFNRMMKLAKINTFNIIAVYKIDRIARNIVDFVNIYDELEKLDVKLISVTEGFDPSTPIGRMMMMLLASFADMERLNIVQRVKDNMLELAKKGCWTGGNVPFGCEVIKENNKSFLCINQPDNIELIFNTYLTKCSLYSTYKFLVEKGIKVTTQREGIGRILRNPVYVKSNTAVVDYLSSSYEIIGKPNGKGFLTYGKNSNNPIAVISKHKGVIEPDLWLKVQTKLDEKRESHFKKESKVYWLSTVLKCPFCNSDYILVNSGKNSYYACSNRINRTNMGLNTQKEKCINNKYVNATTIENKVENLISFLENKCVDDFNTIYNNSLNHPNIFESKVDSISKKINKNNKSIDNLVEKLMLLSNAAATPITKKIEELTLENEQLKISLEVEKLNDLEHELNTNTPNLIFANILRFRELKTNDDKRQALRTIFKKLTYNPFDDSLKPEFI